MTSAKAWLRGVRDLDDEVATKAERVMRLRAQLECPRSVLSDMPRGGGVKDWSITADKLVDMERELDEVTDKLVDLKRDIECELCRIPDDRMRDIIRMRYIEFRGWGAIVEKMRGKCEERTVYYLHALALREISLRNIYGEALPLQ